MSGVEIRLPITIPTCGPKGIGHEGRWLSSGLDGTNLGWRNATRPDRGIETQRMELVIVNLSYEVFHRDLDALVEFYGEVLDFHRLRSGPAVDYAVMHRGGVRVGCCRHDHADSTPRRPPDGSEIVLRVDDIQAEYDRILLSSWPLADPLQDRPWGLRDFRLFDPSGHYLRITSSPSNTSTNSHA